MDENSGQTIEELMVRMGLDLDSLRQDIRQFKSMASGMVEDADKAGVKAASSFVSRARGKMKAEIGRIRQAAFEGFLPDEAAMQRSISAIKRYNGRIVAEMRRLQQAGALNDTSASILGNSLRSLPRVKSPRAAAWSNDALEAARKAYDERMHQSRIYEMGTESPDPKRIRDNARQAAREFNSALLSEINRLQSSGKMDDLTFRRLSAAMKNIPREIAARPEKPAKWSNEALSNARRAYDANMFHNRMYEVNTPNPNPTHIRESARKAARDFNSALISEISRLQKEGKLDDVTFRRLSAAMKVIPPSLRTRPGKKDDPAQAFLDSLNSNFRHQKSELSISQAAGLVTPEKAREEAIRVAKSYNDALLGELNRLKSMGPVPETVLNRFAESIKKLPKPLSAARPVVPRGPNLSPEFKSARETFEGDMARIRAAFMSKSISPSDAQKKAHDIAVTFNKALTSEINRALSTGDKNLAGKLSRGFKPTGRRAGAEFGEGLKAGMESKTGAILNVVRGIFSLQILSMIGSFVGGAVRMLQGIASGVDSVAQRAGQVQRLRTAFIALNNSMGESASTMMTELRKGSRNTASDMQLMLRANMALTARLPVTAKSLGEAVMLARRLGNASGMGTEEAFSRIIRGTGKLEIELLDELGLLNGVKRALAQYEAQTGKSADSLSQAAKVQLFWNATIAEAREKVASMGPDIMTAADRMDQLKAAFENFKNEAATVIADTPSLIKLLDEIGAASSDSADKVGDLADRLGALLDTTIKLGGQSSNTPLAKFNRGMAGIFNHVTPFGLFMKYGFEPTSRWATGSQGADKEYESALRHRKFLRGIRNMESISDLENMRNEVMMMNSSLQEIMANAPGKITWDRATRGYTDSRGKKWLPAAHGGGYSPEFSAWNVGAIRDDDPEIVEKRANALRVIDERLAQLRAKGTRTRDTNNPEKIKQSKLNKVESVRDEMEKALDEITFTTLDELTHQIDRAEREAKQAFEALGQKLPESMAEGFKRRRSVIDAQVELVNFQKRYNEITRTPDSTPRMDALESDIEILRAQQEYVDQGTRAWREYNAIIDSTEESLSQATLEHLNQQLQQQRILLSDLVNKRDALEEGSSIREEYNDQIRNTNDLIRNTIRLINEQGTKEKVTHAQKLARLRREKKEAKQQQLDRIREIRQVADSMADFMSQFAGMGDTSLNAFKSISQIGEGIAGVASGLDIAGGITGILGGIGTLFGDTERSRAIRENSERLRELSQKLDRALNVADITSGAAGIAAAQRSGLLESLQMLYHYNPKMAKDHFNEFLSQYGSSVEELSKLAKEYGIQIFTDSGKIIWKGVTQLGEALGYIIEDLAKFGESLSEQRQARELLDNVNDVKETPQHIVQREMELLNKFSPQLASQYGLTNADSSTEEGRKAIKEAIKRLLNDIFTNVLDPTLLGTFANLDDLISIIQNVEGAFDTLNDSLNNFQTGLENAPEGFKYALEKFNATVAEHTLGLDPNSLTHREVRSQDNRSTTIQFGDVIIQESSNGTGTYRQLYEQMLSAARNQGPDAINAVLQLPKPKP